jgi:hypothetical protein
MAKKPPEFVLQVRYYPADPRFCSVWIRRRDGAVHAGQLWGELIPPAVEELMAWAADRGIPIEEDHSPIRPGKPISQPGVPTVEEQPSLFGK